MNSSNILLIFSSALIGFAFGDGAIDVDVGRVRGRVVGVVVGIFSGELVVEAVRSVLDGEEVLPLLGNIERFSGLSPVLAQIPWSEEGKEGEVSRNTTETKTNNE
jgi:hypothetical protein